RIENRTITVEEILEAENRIRAVPIKRSSVVRAINALGYHTSEMLSKISKRKENEKEKEVEVEVEKPKRAVPDKTETVVYSSNIDKIADATVKRFNSIKASWEEDLGKALHNDHFVNILIALAILAQKHGKSLTPVKR
ncbi:MAG: hypothetical protein H0M93_05870, partial [Methanophagales archaeon]|nr:hypothetical protein [Methanophagales archaeon]